MEAVEHLFYADLVDRLAPIFERHGCTDAVARRLAENCAAGERDGIRSHGLFRMAGYVSTLKSGWADGRAVPGVEDCAPGFIRVDGANGFTVPALAASRALLVSKARRNGIAILAIRNSHHLGALSLDVEPFAEEGLVAMAFINTMRSVVPFGGTRAVFGTNPIAFAAPRAGAPPFVFDMATSAVAHGDVQIARRENRDLPPNTGVDRHGQPTTDPAAVLEGGAIVPFGGHKGAALAMTVEILCAALAGGSFSMDVELSPGTGGVTPRTGQTILVVDPDCGRGGAMPGLAERVAMLADAVHAAGQQHLAGERRHAARARAERDGIPVPVATLQALDALLAP